MTEGDLMSEPLTSVWDLDCKEVKLITICIIGVDCYVGENLRRRLLKVGRHTVLAVDVCDEKINHFLVSEHGLSGQVQFHGVGNMKQYSKLEDLIKSTDLACLLKIESSTRGWEKSLEKLLKSFNDVNFTIDKRSKTVYVYGKSDPEIILEKMRKTGLKVEIVWSNLQGSKKPQENRKEHSLEQCCNAPPPPPPPNGFWNYPPQPMQPWMNHHHQMFGLPSPYPRQLQPMEPPPYEFHQNEPAAKSFPANAPQPKNFTMGDLQVCNIM